MVEVDDGGGQMYAQTFCAAFAGASGWTEDTQAEQTVVQQVQKAQKAQQQKAQRAVATQQARQQVADDASALTADIESLREAAASLASDSLGSDISALQGDLGTVQGDLRTVQSDSSDVICGDAGVAGGDEGVMEGDVGVMEGDIGTFQADIQRVSDAISTLRQDQQSYLSDSASTGYRSTDVPTNTQIVASISNANGAVAKLRASFQVARSQAAQLVAQAKGYVAQADTICKRAGG